MDYDLMLLLKGVLTLIWCNKPHTDLYLSQIPSLAILHGQQWQVIGGHNFLHPLRNLPCCDHINMIQPE